MAKTLVLVLAALLAAALPLGRSAAADSEAATLDMVIQTAFVQDVDGFCAAPVPRCDRHCENGNVVGACDDSGCGALTCVHLDPLPWCGAFQFDQCDCL